MSDLAWRAEGIANARAVGGIDLELYHKPGFGSTIGVRRATEGGPGSGLWADKDYDDHDADPTPEEERRRD